MRDRCLAAGIGFWHKQSAAFRPEQGVELDGEIIHEPPRCRIPLPLCICREAVPGVDEANGEEDEE